MPDGTYSTASELKAIADAAATNATDNYLNGLLPRLTAAAELGQYTITVDIISDGTLKTAVYAQLTTLGFTHTENTEAGTVDISFATAS